MPHEHRALRQAKNGRPPIRFANAPLLCGHLRFSMIRALVFDFDGLILDTETPLIEAYGDVHAAHGRPFDRSNFLRCIGHVDIVFDEWAAFGKTADRVELHRQMRESYERRIVLQPILPGVVALLDAADAAGLRYALASNSSHAHCERHLGRIGLRERFAFLACREDVASPKPEPDIYRLAVNRLGARPHEAIAFEDSAAGSIAARRAGLWVVAVPNESTALHDLDRAHLRVKSLAEVTLAELSAKFAGK
ncbi:MAG: HAD family phosphatase [Opitutae bacterium]|nr:HAD family phosphatase [Opitutae bacterium]